MTEVRRFTTLGGGIISWGAGAGADGRKISAGR